MFCILSWWQQAAAPPLWALSVSDPANKLWHMLESRLEFKPLFFGDVGEVTDYCPVTHDRLGCKFH